jgi:hypothetical protein
MKRWIQATYATLGYHGIRLLARALLRNLLRTSLHARRASGRHRGRAMGLAGRFRAGLLAKSIIFHCEIKC